MVRLLARVMGIGMLQWQVNHGFDAAADTVPVSAIPRLRQPDALASLFHQLLAHPVNHGHAGSRLAND